MQQNQMQRSRFALGLTLVLALAACRSSGTQGGPVTIYSGSEARVDVDIEGGNRQLKQSLEVVDLRQERRDAFLQVQFQLANQTGGERVLEYSVEWFDASGLSVGQSSNWKRVQIPGFGKHTFQLVGPTPSATDWEFQIRKTTTVR